MLWLADRNRDGILSWQELLEAFKSLGARFPPVQAWLALIYADKNRDGRIDKREAEELVKYAYSLGYTIK
ncbi:hypothetical protein JCGZ_04270 [Jatropha curcas]|uniref:EF-hand domain-containing protein n=1 Tax=Jatropha curcas TaxID=180498 RepID=A0A067L1I4_JATCU|nr:hypothetical protein JCGZ_04270 [Jatropha curcas]